jgi:hypothetical protein
VSSVYLTEEPYEVTRKKEALLSMEENIPFSINVSCSH